MENRKRNIQMKFYVTEEEKRLIDEKMKQLPIKQYGAYLRKMAIDGYCFSRVSATTVIEILYLFLTSMRKDAYKSIVRHEQAIAFTKL